MRFVFLTILLLCLPFAPASAQDYQTILGIPEGQTLISLSASEEVEVQQDLLIANLEVNMQDDDPEALQDDINKAMEKAVALAKKYPSVKVATRQYYVYPYDYDPNPRPVDGSAPQQTKRSWRGSQGLELKGAQANELLELTGELQSMGLVMNGLNYTLSPALLEQTQESLLEAALTKLKAKAERAAKALGKTSADLLEVNIDMGGGYSPQPMMRTMAMDSGAAKMSAPVAEPGQSTVNLTVSARAMLK